MTAGLVLDTGALISVEWMNRRAVGAISVVLEGVWKPRVPAARRQTTV
ncbi:MAG: hypothetical protein ACRDPW_01100 [Mycobacteriales bacterium]